MSADQARRKISSDCTVCNRLFWMLMKIYLRIDCHLSYTFVLKWRRRKHFPWDELHLKAHKYEGEGNLFQQNFHKFFFFFVSLPSTGMRNDSKLCFFPSNLLRRRLFMFSSNQRVITENGISKRESSAW